MINRKIFFAFLGICIAFTTPALLAGDSARVMFVTSVNGTGDLGSWPDAGVTSGLEAADEICRNRAVAGGLANPELFVAYLSGSEDDAFCRLHGLSGIRAENCGEDDPPADFGPWVRTDGVPFGDRTPFLLVPSNRIYNAPFYDEFGNPIALDQRVFTAAGQSGQTAGDTCDDWTSTDGTVFVGWVDRTAGNWALFNSQSCAFNDVHLYCMESGPGPDLDFPNASERFAFVSNGGTGDLATHPMAGPGTSGIEAGDSICNNEADAAGLPDVGSYKAWLSDDSVDARDRFDNDGPWFRIDGFKIAENIADLIDGELMTSIHQDPDGSYLANPGAWTGTNADGTASGNDCGNWESTAGNGTSGRSNAVSGDWLNFDDEPCSNVFPRLYCLSDARWENLFMHGYENGDG